MYKDLYKKANDSIPLNLELKERLKKEAQTEKKTNKLGFLYKYGALAAAIVVVIGVYNILPKPETADKSEKPAKEEQIANVPKVRTVEDMADAKLEMAKTHGRDINPPAYTPLWLDYTGWALPEGLEVTESLDNAVVFSGNDMKISVTVIKDGEGLNENCEIENTKPNNYRINLSRNSKTYLILTENVIKDDIDKLLKSIK